MGEHDAQGERPGVTPELVRLLLELSEAIVADETWEQRMQDLCVRAAGFLECDRVSIFLRDGDRFEGRFNHGNPPDVAALFARHRVALDDPLVAEAIRSNAVVVANDAVNDPRMSRRTARTARIQSIAVAPLMDGSEPLGFMTGEYNERVRDISATQAELLMGVARLAQTLTLLERAEQAAQTAVLEAAFLGRRVGDLEPLAPLGRVTGGVAHDFNNTLAVILGHCEFLDRLTDDDAGRRSESVAAIRDAATRAHHLTRQLLLVGQARPGAAGVHDLATTVDALVPMIATLMPARVRLAAVVEDRPQLVAVDDAQLEHLLMNLVLNARDALGGDGRIDVRLTGDDDTVVLTVTDTGPGIDPAVLPHVFDPFFSTKEAGGVGLGLANVRRICEEADGSVVARSEPGHTVFEIELPRAETPRSD